VRGGSCGVVGLTLVPGAIGFAGRDKWRTVGLWSVGGPGFDRSDREGLGIT